MLIGFVTLASSPVDAGVPGPVRRALAGCEAPELSLDQPETTADVVEGSGLPAVRVHTVQGPAGSGAYLTLRTWLVAPASCRKVALQVSCAGGNPRCVAAFLHPPGKAPSKEEGATLLSWLPGRRLDPQSPAHQSAVTPALARLPEQPEPAEEETPPEPAVVPFSVRAVKQPAPRWLPGAPVAQSSSWTELPDQGGSGEEKSSDAPAGYVTSGRLYAVHRGDCCVRGDGVETVGSARLHTFSSPSRIIDKSWFLALEQPSRHRFAWLVHHGPGVRSLGTFRGRLWFAVPAYMDLGFSLLAIDLQTGESWHLDVERTASFDPNGFLPAKLRPAGIVLRPVEGDAPAAASLTVPWPLVNAALQAAREPPAQ